MGSTESCEISNYYGKPPPIEKDYSKPKAKFALICTPYANCQDILEPCDSLSHKAARLLEWHLLFKQWTVNYLPGNTDPTELDLEKREAINSDFRNLVRNNYDYYGCFPLWVLDIHSYISGPIDLFPAEVILMKPYYASTAKAQAHVLGKWLSDADISVRVEKSTTDHEIVEEAVNRFKLDNVFLIVFNETMSDGRLKFIVDRIIEYMEKD